MCGHERQLVTRTRERHADICELLEAGQPVAAISRAPRLDRRTGHKYARPDIARSCWWHQPGIRLDPFKP